MEVFKPMGDSKISFINAMLMGGVSKDEIVKRFRNSRFEEERQAPFVEKDNYIQPGIVSAMKRRFSSSSDKDKETEKCIRNSHKKKNVKMKKSFKDRHRGQRSPSSFVHFYSSSEDEALPGNISRLETERYHNLRNYAFRKSLQSYARSSAPADSFVVPTNDVPKQQTIRVGGHRNQEPCFHRQKVQDGMNHHSYHQQRRSSSSRWDNNHNAGQLDSSTSQWSSSDSTCESHLQRNTKDYHDRRNSFVPPVAGYETRLPDNNMDVQIGRRQRTHNSIHSPRQHDHFIDTRINPSVESDFSLYDRPDNNVPHGAASRVKLSDKVTKSFVTIGERASPEIHRESNVTSGNGALVKVGSLGQSFGANNIKEIPVRLNLYDDNLMNGEEESKDAARRENLPKENLPRKVKDRKWRKTEDQQSWVSHEAQIENLEFQELRNNRDTVHQLRHKVVFKSHSSFWKNINDVIPNTNSAIQIATSTSPSSDENNTAGSSQSKGWWNQLYNYRNNKKISSNTENINGAPQPRKGTSVYNGKPVVSVKSCGDVVMASYDSQSKLQLRVQEWTFETKFGENELSMPNRFNHKPNLNLEIRTNKCAIPNYLKSLNFSSYCDCEVRE